MSLFRITYNENNVGTEMPSRKCDFRMLQFNWKRRDVATPNFKVHVLTANGCLFDYRPMI